MKKIFKNEYINIFIIAFLIFAVSVVPSLISTGGVWIYYGDFNVQQIPFYIHVHDAIRSGNFFYDWGLDLGGSLIGCFSFYLTGSPFFWLSVPFDSATLPYLMPWINALKYGVMAVTAYAYSKRHLKTEAGAFIAALLFTFSGYQGAVLVYNHFHDSIAFFPLYLLVFERAMEQKKRLPFILMTSFMAVINYYFFVGQVVFLIIYYVARYGMGETAVKDKIMKFFRALYCGTTGVLLACIYLLPAVYYTLHSPRVSDTLLGYDLLSYSEPMAILTIIKNMVMLPDISGLNSMYNTSFSRVSGVAAYIPLFSVSLVIAFFLINKGKKMWEKRTLIICAVFACVPFLNAIFSAMNNEYYARWFYMPVLIMSVMTASLLEDAETRTEHRDLFYKTTNIVFIVTLAIAITGILPAETSGGERTILGALKNPEQLICEIIFSVVMVIIAFAYFTFIADKKNLFTKLVVIGGCFLTTITMLIEGTVLVESDRKESFISQALSLESPLYEGEGFYRIETEEDVYNYPLLWNNAHSITSFISTIPSSTIDFYTAFNGRRKVTSNLGVSKIGMKAFLSGKYFLKENETAIEHIGHIDDMEDLKGYIYKEDINGFSIYENENYIPMGFSFDSYITESEFEEAEYNSTAKDRLTVRTLVLSDEVAELYSDILEHAEPENFSTSSYNEFKRACEERRQTSCNSFETSTNGFTADVDMEKEGVLLFTVPYENGFAAYVDGVETDISKADYGFMMIRVPEGHHDIVFEYTLSDLKYGKILSVIGLGSLLFALPVIYIVGRKKENNKKRQKMLDLASPLWYIDC